jgi:hypothetical protein
MDNIMNMAMAAFQGTHAIEAIVIAIVLALIMGSLMQDIIFALIAVIIQLFLPLVYGVVGGKAGEAGKMAGDIFHSYIPGTTESWERFAVMYVAFLIVIGLLYLIKSVLFRR